MCQAKYPGTTIVFDMSLTYICSAFVGVVLNNAFVEKFSLRLRVTVGYVLSFVMLLFVAVCDVGMSAFGDVTSYRVTLIAVILVALGCTGIRRLFLNY
jgi:solute carrier family 29 (equilibrative nucleoside transporter), member 4